MTPEERAAGCVKLPKVGDGFDWNRVCSGPTPIDIEDRIADAIRAAVAEERNVAAKKAQDIADEYFERAKVCEEEWREEAESTGHLFNRLAKSIRTGEQP